MTTRPCPSEPPTIYKASGPGIDGPIPDLRLVATEQVPEMATLADADAFYREQGRVLADALSASLSGGTMHALLVELLDRKRSLLRITDHAPAVRS
jgi:hypothetical protein